MPDLHYTCFKEMQLEDLHIQPTENTPEIMLKSEGQIIIKGRGMVLDNTEITDRVIAWIEKYMKNPADTTRVFIGFEYLNSYCTSKLISVIRKISELSRHGKKYIINWYYEEDDEDILERGEYISSSFKIPVNFILTKDIKSCC